MPPSTPQPPTHVAPPPRRPGHRSEHQRDIINRLRRIEGQVRALTEMIESGRSCEEVAQQMSAAATAMD